MTEPCQPDPDGAAVDRDVDLSMGPDPDIPGNTDVEPRAGSPEPPD